MALPKFNDVPTYELTVPSNKKKYTFRPFLVKEQKVLLIALESRDDTQILRAITDTIKSCVQETIDVNALTTFDVEYIFIQIRTKSAGETSNIGITCKSCDHVNSMAVKLDDIVIDVKEEPTIKLNDKYSLELQYPKYSALLEESSIKDETQVEQLYRLIAASLKSLMTEEERISFKDHSYQEVEEIINELSTDQFAGISEFVNNLPTLSHEVEFTCEQCGTQNTRLLQGIQDFFQLPFPTRV